LWRYKLNEVCDTKTLQENINTKIKVNNSGKRVEISRVPSLIPLKYSKIFFEKSKFYKEKGKELAKNTKA